MIPGFPIAFQSLRNLYAGFRPDFEPHRESFADWWVHYLRQASLADFQGEVNGVTAVAGQIRAELKQRHFYRSATSFYRSFDLFLAFLSLQRNHYSTWAEVTGYYSRFYFIQAFMNLLQASWFGAEDSIPSNGLINPGDRRFLVFHDGTRIISIGQRELAQHIGGDRPGSHGVWWKLFGCLGGLDDFPQLETLGFVLGDGYFNVVRRNEVNYSHEWVCGFPELEWFDTDVNQMMAHFNFQHRRRDRDITNIDRFFGDDDREDADVGDFYGDEAQMLWCSVDCFLRVLRALEIDQRFISAEKLAALTRSHIGPSLPRLTEGIIASVGEALGE